MANIKTSELIAATLPLTGDELVDVSQLTGGVYNSVRAATANIGFAGVKLGSFYDVTDQTGNPAAATAVKFASTDINTKGVTVVTSGGNPTRVTYAAGGTYMIAVSLQLANSDTADNDATIWFAKNGTNVPASATKVTVPKVADGGSGFFQIVYYIVLAAGDYVEVRWLPESATVTIDHAAAGAIAPAAPSALLVTERIGV